MLGSAFESSFSITPLPELSAPLPTSGSAGSSCDVAVVLSDADVDRMAAWGSRAAAAAAERRAGAPSAARRPGAGVAPRVLQRRRGSHVCLPLPLPRASAGDETTTRVLIPQRYPRMLYN